MTFSNVIQELPNHRPLSQKRWMTGEKVNMSTASEPKFRHSLRAGHEFHTVVVRVLVVFLNSAPESAAPVNLKARRTQWERVRAAQWRSAPQRAAHLATVRANRNVVQGNR